MRGIILAGGSGSRLYPITRAISKHLLPIYDKPMIYYPLSALMLAGIKEILVISTPDHIELYKRLLGKGNQIGLDISYSTQSNPRGIADAFIVGEKFIAGNTVALILGDNFFYGPGFSKTLKEASQISDGALIFGYTVRNPEEFGVVEFDNDLNILSIEEKPKIPKSDFAIPGMYFFDDKVVEIAKKLTPSKRGELEITDLIKVYLKQGTLHLKVLGRGFAWLDTGTHSGLLEASNFGEIIQRRQGLYISCIEEIAYRMGYIDKEDLKIIVNGLENTDYGNYIKMIIRDVA